MDMLAEKLDTKLREWEPNITATVKERILEIIDLADRDALDIMRSRAVEQEVLDILDEPVSRRPARETMRHGDLTLQHNWVISITKFYIWRLNHQNN